AAYEVGAIYNRDVRIPEVSVTESEEKASDDIKVKIEDQEANPYYGARIIKDVTVEASPLWLQNRLMAAGVRPINNIVDVTNYVLLEYGQPLHAFDYDRFDSEEVVTRRATNGEELVTLDGETRQLSTDHLVITNGKRPVALAGVMGGADTEVKEDTT